MPLIGRRSSVSNETASGTLTGNGGGTSLAAAPALQLLTYRFRLIATNGGVGSVCVMKADSDDKACELASELLLESIFPIIEVWRARKMIYRVRKVDPK